MKTYFFETYGCEMNIAESASVEQLFISRGWKKAENAQVADVCVINTCSIRKTAEDRILGRLGWFSGLKKIRECKPDAKAKFYTAGSADLSKCFQKRRKHNNQKSIHTQVD